MLLRLHLQGFKSHLNTIIRFTPLTCFAGPNAAGKSNLFDAIRFLSLLADHPIHEAVAKVRESPGRTPDPAGLFTHLGEKWIAPEIKLVADFLVPKEVVDDYGQKVSANHAALRYTLVLKRSEKGGEPVLKHESLERLDRTTAQGLMKPWSKKPFWDSMLHGRSGSDLLSTTQDGNQIEVHQDGKSGRKRIIHINQGATVTALNGAASAEFPTLLAAKRAMQHWVSLQLEPSAMRAPCEYRSPKQVDARGAYMPAALDRLVKSEGPDIRAEVAGQLGRLVEDIKDIEVHDDKAFNTLAIVATMRDGTKHEARSLSDGTLRFLVMALLRLDPTIQGVLCLEEPENGIHPSRIQAMLDLIRGVAVDPRMPVGEDNPLRQVLINTHSPVVFNQTAPEETLFIEEAKDSRDNQWGRISLVQAPSNTWRCNHAAMGNDVMSPFPSAKIGTYLQAGAHLLPADEQTAPLWAQYIRENGK